MSFNRASFEPLNSFVGKTLWTYWTRDNVATGAIVGVAYSGYWTDLYKATPNIATGDLVISVEENNSGSAILTAFVVKNATRNGSSMLRVL